ncbi:MAG: hypothetical protein ACUVX1_14480 [Chloroflexota bacterium]
MVLIMASCPRCGSKMVEVVKEPHWYDFGCVTCGHHWYRHYVRSRRVRQLAFWGIDDADSPIGVVAGAVSI